MVLTFKDRLSLNALSIVLLFVSSNSSLSKGTKCAPKNNGNTEFPEIAIGNRAIISDSENVTNLISTTSTAQSEKIEKIQISEDIEILENDEKFLKIPDNGRRRDGPVGQLELICSASYPVQWGFRLYQLWAPWTVSSRRILSPANASNPNVTQIFQSILKYPSLRNITQLRNDYPTCHKSDDTCLQTSLSVMNDGEKPRLKVAAGSDLQLSPDSEFGKNTNCSLRVGYDPVAQVFFCQTVNPKQNVTIFPRTCSDPVKCATVYMAQNENCSHEAPTVSYKDCRPDSGCGKMTYAADYLPSVAICLIRGTGDELGGSVAVPFFYSLVTDSHGQPERYLNWNDANPTKMLQIMELSESSFYAGQEFAIQCKASYYYFGSGLYFEIKSELSVSRIPANETTYTKRTTGKSGTFIDLEYLRILAVQNYVAWTPGVYQIQCNAPVWNTTEWVSTNATFTVLESTPPKFFDGNTTETLYYKPNLQILCISRGVPKPLLTWTLNESPLPSGINVEIGENGTDIWTQLQFPSSTRGIYGNFTCRSTNYAGYMEKTFIIIPSDKTSSTLIIAIAVMGILALILVPSVVFLFWKVQNQRKQLQYLTQEEVDEFLLGKPDYIPFQCDMSTYAYYLPYDKSFEIPREELNIDFSKVLGQGAYGMVIYGKYQEKEVAVKTIKPVDYGMDTFKALLSELKIMTYIGKHENIVNLVGACTTNIQKKEVYIALEFCENGSLLSFMRTHRHSFLNPSYVPEGDELAKSPLTRQPSFLQCPQVQYVKMEDLSQIAILNPHDYANMFQITRQDLIQWSYQIAEGMDYLTSKKVIHGDLAARNVLLTRDLTAKIGDFGLSKRLLHYNSYTRTANTPLPIKWLAIECLTDFQFSPESDVWSYGVTLWEIFSLGELPYAGFNGNGEDFLQRLSRGMRLNKPIYCSEEIFDVIMKCWKSDRKERPKFDILSRYFKRCLETPAHEAIGVRLSNLENEVIPT